MLGPGQTSLRIVGGTVKKTEVHTLKRLIFRGTRGKALVQTFDINLDISDVLNNKSFTFDYSYWSHDGSKEEKDGYSAPDPSHPNGKKFCDQV